MKMEDIISREVPPEPWAEGEKIPWDDPEFSERMLMEHLSQAHDMASRRQEMIDRHVAWIEEACLPDRPARILDLGCGPGFYSQRLAQRGHSCIGIDFSPASIAYATSLAADAGMKIDYIQGDIRNVDYGEGFDLVMLVFGEFNVFKKDDARRILVRIHQSLNLGGRVLLEPQTYEAIESEGSSPPIWHSATGGLFSPNPHLWLEEHYWHAGCHAATTRHFIADAATLAISRYASTTQAYTDEELGNFLAAVGFSEMETFPSLAGAEGDRQEGLFALTAMKATDQPE